MFHNIHKNAALRAYASVSIHIQQKSIGGHKWPSYGTCSIMVLAWPAYDFIYILQTYLKYIKCSSALKYIFHITTIFKQFALILSNA